MLAITSIPPPPIHNSSVAPSVLSSQTVNITQLQTLPTTPLEEIDLTLASQTSASSPQLQMPLILEESELTLAT